MKKVVLVGNPNVGKTSIFNYITGSQFRVGNFPGVTVEKRHANIDFDGQNLELIDLPGVYSFASRSPDEEITRQYLLSNNENSPDIILNIVNANNLERNLYLTTSLLQLGKPMILIVTMMDIAKKNGINLDLNRLSENLGIPVIGVNQNNKQDKDRVFQAIIYAEPPQENIVFPTILFQNIEPLQQSIQNFGVLDYQDKAGFIAFKILEDDKQIQSQLNSIPSIIKAKEKVMDKLKELFYYDIMLVLAQFRYNFIDRVLRNVKLSERKRSTLTQKIDKYLLHQYWGIPLFVIIVWFCFKVAVTIGSAFQDFFDIAAGAIFVDFTGYLLQNYPFLKLLISDSIGSGIQALCTFIPVIFSVFLTMNILEDTGYLARITVLVDKIMRWLGLPGKALAPLIMGFGCNVVSIFGARILETPQERKLSIIMSPFISCGARLPVYTLITLAIFPADQGSMIAALYIIGIIFSILTAFIVSRMLFKKQEYSFLLLELPEYHSPKIGMIFKISWRRVKGLMWRAFKLVIVFMAFYQILDNITLAHPQQGIIAKDSDKSFIRTFGEGISYPLSLMGVQKDSWPLAVGLINGLLAKEAVVGTLVVAFAAEDAKNQIKIDSAEETIEQKSTFKEAISNIGLALVESFKTIPHNLIGNYNKDGVWEPGVLTDIGFYVPLYTVFHNVEELAPEEASLTSKIQISFADPHETDSRKRAIKAKIAAFSYLLFILLYTGCIAVLSAINKELGKRWMWGILLYQLFLAYGIAVLFYQLGCIIVG